MHIAAGICTYASPHLLARCIESLRGLVDVSIVIHGRFKGFPEIIPHNESFVMTMRVIEKYSNVVVIDSLTDTEETFGTEPRTQMYHRNRYLQEARREGADWLLVIDDDDYIIKPRTDVLKVRQNLEELRRQIDSKKEQDRFFLYDVICIQTEDEQLPLRYGWKRPRMLYEPGYFSYLDTAHYHLKDPIGRIYRGHAGHSIVNGLFLRHDQDANDQMRLPQYMDAKRKYVQWQRSNESG